MAERSFTCESCEYSYALKLIEPYPEKCAQCGDPVTKRSVELKGFEEVEIGGLAPGASVVVKEFVKYDEGKTDWSLLPPEVMAGIIDVLMHGAAKYSPTNWKKGTKWSRYYNAALRHITAFWLREDLDPESKCHHLDHALCCLVFLRYFTMYPQYFEHDNREPKNEMSTLSQESGHGN
jgi:hypothetical protein